MEELEVMSGNQRFNFGKHKGRKLSTVVEEDPSYILWAFLNIEDFMPAMNLLYKAKLNSNEEILEKRVSKAFKMALKREANVVNRIIRG